MANSNAKRFWKELLRRRVVRVAVIYLAGAWILAQAVDLLLDAFDSSQYMRLVVAGLAVGLPIALVLSWVFDITPSGIERTPDRPDPVDLPPAAPESSIAVLPFANLSQDVENEYFSDGLSEEIRNQLARVSGLRVAARTSSFAFKGRHEDVREIGRRLSVATVLEGGVRKQADTVRIDVQLVSAADGYQIWSETFERRLDDIFRLQREVASAVIAAIGPRKAGEEGAPSAPATQSVEAYNLYLLGRHHFHKRTEASLERAVAYFEQAIEQDSAYALAYSGLADAYTLLSAGYYGNMPAMRAVTHALPAAQRALELAPDLAEAHASLGLIHHNQGDLVTAQAALERALALNPGYTMAHVWHGLVLTTQGRYRDAEARNREALRLDPLSPIANTNAGFDALRFGDGAEAAARFAVAIEIDPEFAVPYSGMAKLHSTHGALEDALRWIDQAIERAPTRAFYLARKGLILLQVGDDDAAAALIEAACRSSPGNAFDSDLVVALRVVRDDRSELARIADGRTDRSYSPSQRAQAHLAVGNLEAARALYEQQAPDTLGAVNDAINDAVNDNWVWRLPHIVNHAHLRVIAGEASGRHDLEQLLAQFEDVQSQGIVNMDLSYWAVSAYAVLGRSDVALQRLDEAIGRGWRHAWWARHDWNMSSLADDSRYRDLLRRG